MELVLYLEGRASLPATRVCERELNASTVLRGRNPLDMSGIHQSIDQSTWTAGLADKPTPDIAQ